MFRKPLELIVERTDGCIGALIMGTDGIAVEKFLTADGQDTNLDVAAAEFTSLVRNAQRTCGDGGLGSLRELVVSSEKATLVMRLLSRDYFMVIALKEDGNLGRSRFELRKAELDLAKEFAL